MSKEEELSWKVEGVIDSLRNCQEYIKEGNSFEAEYWIGDAIKTAREVKPYISAWADEQEKELGEEEEAKGYEVTNEKQ